MSLIIVLLFIAFILLYLPTQESMTNKDMMSLMSTFGQKDERAPKKKDKEPHEIAIYGPKAPKPVEPPPSKTKGKNGTSDSAMSAYPDIYGPDVPMKPNAKHLSGKETSDDVSNESYDFNVDLQKAFPTSGPPEPFLTDFSKFQH